MTSSCCASSILGKIGKQLNIVFDMHVETRCVILDLTSCSLIEYVVSSRRANTLLVMRDRYFVVFKRIRVGIVQPSAPDARRRPSEGRTDDSKLPDISRDCDSIISAVALADSAWARPP